MTLSLKASPATATNAMRRELRLVSGLCGGADETEIQRSPIALWSGSRPSLQLALLAALRTKRPFDERPLQGMGFRRGLQKSTETPIKQGPRCTTISQMRHNEINGLPQLCTKHSDSIPDDFSIIWNVRTSPDLDILERRRIK